MIATMNLICGRGISVSPLMSKYLQLTVEFLSHQLWSLRCINEFMDTVVFACCWTPACVSSTNWLNLTMLQI